MLAAIERYGMVAAGHTVVVAVSGGPDSTALLHSLWSLRSQLNIHTVAATMEHGIRGAESVADVEYVSTLCSQLDMPIHIGHRDIPEIAKSRRVSTSVAARDERHRFLRQVAGEVCEPGAERIALGHTADDRAETVLMNILRGAGTNGLCKRCLPLIFQLYAQFSHAREEQVDAYCTESGLQPRIDLSNAKPQVSTKNRIRTGTASASCYVLQYGHSERTEPSGGDLSR